MVRVLHPTLPGAATASFAPLLLVPHTGRTTPPPFLLRPRPLVGSGATCGLCPFAASNAAPSPAWAVGHGAPPACGWPSGGLSHLRLAAVALNPAACGRAPPVEPPAGRYHQLVDPPAGGSRRLGLSAGGRRCALPSQSISSSSSFLMPPGLPANASRWPASQLEERPSVAGFQVPRRIPGRWSTAVLRPWFSGASVASASLVADDADTGVPFSLKNGGAPRRAAIVPITKLGCVSLCPPMAVGPA